MSIVDTTIGGNWAANSLGLLVPAPASCICFFYPCTAGMAAGSTTILTDYSPAKQNASLSGNPAINAGYMSFGGPSSPSFAQTNTLDPLGDLSFVFVTRSIDTFADSMHSPTYISNYGGDAGSPNPVTGIKGITVKYTAAGGGGMVATDYANNAGAAMPTLATVAPETGLELSTFRAYAYTIATVGMVTTRTFFELTDGLPPAVAPSTLPRVPNYINPFKFGEAANAPNGGLSDFAFYGMWSSALTNAQLNLQVMPFLRTNMTSKGITV